MFCKRRHYKNPTCFGHYSMTIFRGRPTFLVHSPLFSCLLRHLSFFGFVAICLLFVCVSGVTVCVLSGCAKHDQTTHRQVHRACGIATAQSTAEDPLKMVVKKDRNM
jgi:hypothetical protein